MKIRTEFFSFRNRVVVIVVGVTLGALSLLYTNDMARLLSRGEAAGSTATTFRWGFWALHFRFSETM